MSTFPDGRFDTLGVLGQTVPEYWTVLHGQRELFVDLLRGAAFLERQLDQSAEELWATVDRHLCPVYHTELVYPITLTEAAGVASALGYAGATEYAVPADLADLPLLTDSPTAPAAVLVSGTDYVLGAGTLTFARSPFADERLAPEVQADGTRLVRLYGVRAGVDLRYAARLYAPAAGAPAAASSPNYLKLINAALDAVATAAAAEHVFAAVEAMTGVELASGTETVEAVAADARGLLVVTDERACRYAAGAAAVAAVGDRPARGEALADPVVVYRPADGRVPAGLTRLALGPGYLTTPAGKVLVFPNADVPVTVTTGVSGYTKLTFPLGGSAVDAAAFFTEMHSRGVAAGATLANYLDVRATPVGQPTAANLPATVNPLGLAFENLLGRFLTVVAVKAGLTGADARFDAAPALRQFTNPHGAVMFVFAGGGSEEVDGSAAGGAAGPGVDEAYALTT